MLNGPIGPWCKCCQGVQRVGSYIGSEALRLGDLLVDLLAVDRHLTGGLEAQPHGAAANFDDVDLDVLADPDALADAAGECEHELPLHGCVQPSVACPAAAAELYVVHPGGRRPAVLLGSRRPETARRLPDQRRKSSSEGWIAFAVAPSDAS